MSIQTTMSKIWFNHIQLKIILSVLINLLAGIDTIYFVYIKHLGFEMNPITNYAFATYGYIGSLLIHFIFITLYVCLIYTITHINIINRFTTPYTKLIWVTSINIIMFALTYDLIHDVISTLTVLYL